MTVAVDSFSVDNRTIWVSGSSRGVGFGVGRHLLRKALGSEPASCQFVGRSDSKDQRSTND